MTVSQSSLVRKKPQSLVSKKYLLKKPSIYIADVFATILLIGGPSYKHLFTAIYIAERIVTVLATGGPSYNIVFKINSY